MKAISVGEVLWDVIGTEQHLGGAPFNFAVHLQSIGHSVWFVSAVGEDDRGRRILQRMRELGLRSQYVTANRQYPTGVARVTVDQGQPRFVIEHPAAYDFPALSREQVAELAGIEPDLLYFGTLFQMSHQARDLTSLLLGSLPKCRRFYDVNLRASSYQPGLVQDLLGRADIVKVNDDEVGLIATMLGWDGCSPEQFCRKGTGEFGWNAVCVTRGAQGSVMLIGDDYVCSRGFPVKVQDTIGAGDAFSAAFAHGLESGWPPEKIGDFANRVGALVASRAGAIPSWTIDEAMLLER